MAGICGIIRKNVSPEDVILHERSLQSMLVRLSADDNQKRDSISLQNCSFGNIAPQSCKRNENFIFNRELGICCIIDGSVSIDRGEKLFIEKKYAIAQPLPENDYIPYLYHHFKSEYVKHLGGWFNIFICDTEKMTVLLSNDRLGFLPLFYYETDAVFIFSSRIEGILASGLMAKIEFDAVTMTEHLLFNYPVSDKTFIKQISALPAAVNCSLEKTAIQSVYWNPGELICGSPLNKAQSLDTIDNALKQVIKKPFISSETSVGATLTGGWDGRLVLAYMLPEYRDRLHLFSFGAETSPDVTIPAEIAHKEGVPYHSVVLNQEYINNSFLDSARKTIRYSNGMRSYRRSHYMYAAQTLTPLSGTFVSGNFGDEMFKFAQVLPSEVITKELLAIVQSGFSLRPRVTIGGSSPVSDLLKNSDTREELQARLSMLENEVAGYSTISEKFHHLKMTRVAGKYFGTEANSYNDFIGNFSPFLDFDFLSAFCKTSFSGIYHPFNANKLKDKEMSSLLYVELIRRNHEQLLKYNTDRGFTMKELTHPLGKLSVLFKKKFRKQLQVKDPYFLGQADNLFQTFLESQIPVINTDFSDNKPMPENLNTDTKMKDKIMSLSFWMNEVRNEYIN